jgi:hypothetical protein
MEHVFNKVEPAGLVPDWLRDRFDERSFTQIVFSVFYAESFHHGADGHNSMLIIARLIGIIRELEADLKHPKQH